MIENFENFMKKYKVDRRFLREFDRVEKIQK